MGFACCGGKPKADADGPAGGAGDGTGKKPAVKSPTKKQAKKELIAELESNVPTQVGAWHEAMDAIEWSGPKVPETAPSEEEEPLMVPEQKTMMQGMPMFPWEAGEWTAKQYREIMEACARDINLDASKGRPDCTKLSTEAKMHHLRRCIADVLKSKVYHFMLRMFEGPELELEVASHRFLSRLLRGCKDSIYYNIDKPFPEAYADVAESKKTGAAAYLRMFLVRFAKRFPPAQGFVNPAYDSPASRERIISECGEQGLALWNFMEATEHHPAACVLLPNNKTMKAFNAVPKPWSWKAVNLFYEYAICEPSYRLADQASIFIIDTGKLGMTMWTASVIKAVASQLAAAQFHPEPFSAFVIAHSPALFNFAWSIGKYFITETAREKFVVLSGSAAAHFEKIGVAREHIPPEIGGTSKSEVLLKPPDVLRRMMHKRAINAHYEQYGDDLKDMEDSAFESLGTLSPNSSSDDLGSMSLIKRESLRRESFGVRRFGKNKTALLAAKTARNTTVIVFMFVMAYVIFIVMRAGGDARRAREMLTAAAMAAAASASSRASK